ncbi:DUF4190 domain-containing protein [Candidatus Woesearchaeota archaeon]|nr:DUF4190 domain-containing protein [Candidatus Woesearchaeota archaeon]
MTSKDMAVTSIILSALCWIPLLNFAIAPAAFYTGLKAFLEIKKNSAQQEGKLMAIIGMLIGISVTVFSYSWLVIRMINR